jgi:hypothetical protein
MCGSARLWDQPLEQCVWIVIDVWCISHSILHLLGTCYPSLLSHINQMSVPPLCLEITYFGFTSSSWEERYLQSPPYEILQSILEQVKPMWLLEWGNAFHMWNTQEFWGALWKLLVEYMGPSKFMFCNLTRRCLEVCPCRKLFQEKSNFLDEISSPVT